MTGRLRAVSGGCSEPPGAGATSSRWLQRGHTSSMGPVGGVEHVSAARGASPVVSGLPLNPSRLRDDQAREGKGYNFTINQVGDSRNMTNVQLPGGSTRMRAGAGWTKKAVGRPTVSELVNRSSAARPDPTADAPCSGCVSQTLDPKASTSHAWHLTDTGTGAGAGAGTGGPVE